MFGRKNPTLQTAVVFRHESGTVASTVVSPFSIPGNRLTGGKAGAAEVLSFLRKRSIDDCNDLAGSRYEITFNPGWTYEMYPVLVVQGEVFRLTPFNAEVP